MIRRQAKAMMHFTPDTQLTTLADTTIARVYLVHMPSNHCLYNRACSESLCSCHLSAFSGWFQICSHMNAILDSTSTNPHKGQVPRIQRPITTFCTLRCCTSPPYSFKTHDLALKSTKYFHLAIWEWMNSFEYQQVTYYPYVMSLLTIKIAYSEQITSYHN